MSDTGFLSRMRVRPKAVLLALLGVAAVLLLLYPVKRIAVIDDKADAYFSTAIARAGVAYATCRAVNAVVSVVKESQLQVQPAGVGVSIAVGQILDPLDDMTERASDVLVTAIVSLGIQKVGYEIAAAFGPQLIAVLVLLWLLLGLLHFPRSRIIRDAVMGLVVLAAVARLCLPLTAYASSFLHDQYFEPRITLAEKGLSIAAAKGEAVSQEITPPGGLIDGLAQLKERAQVIADAAKELVGRGLQLIDTLLTLSFLYVAYFLVQVVLLPVAVFWLLVRLVNLLFRSELPTTLRQADVAQLLQPDPAAKEDKVVSP